MSVFKEILYATAYTVRDQALDVLTILFAPSIKRTVHSAIAPVPKTSVWLTHRVLAPKIAIDGAVLEGPIPGDAYAKFALRKGLPKEGARTLAVENDPHRVDDFSGVIEKGYGKGVKTLLSNEIVIVKIGGKSFPAKMNYHVHQADRAGLHYDLVVEGVPPGTKKWEMNIPRGEFKGRYAFNTTNQGVIVTPMKDRGLVIPKPDYTLKDEEFLKKVQDENNAALGAWMNKPGSGVSTEKPKLPWVVEQKLDGSLGNVAIVDDRAMFRSHRESGETYYDRLPSLEHLRNQSSFWLFRKVFPGPNQNGTVLVGELYHPEGAARVGGILNAHPHNSRRIQEHRGMVSFYGWDIIKSHGRDVRHLPYAERRALLERTIRDIRFFNKNWDVVPVAEGDAHEFYKKVIENPLPFGEGVVIKKADQAHGEGPWYKVKQNDLADFEVVEILEGQGKYAGSVGRLVVSAQPGQLSPGDRSPGQRRAGSIPRSSDRRAVGEVGSFAITDEQRQWIWDHREDLIGSVAKVRVQEVTDRGIPRAGVFVAFHEGKGSEAGLLMYAESLAGGDPKETKSMLYRLKSAAGWRQ